MHDSSPVNLATEDDSVVRLLFSHIISGSAGMDAGYKFDTPKDYSVQGSRVDKAFGIFNGITIMSFAYGNTIIPGDL